MPAFSKSSGIALDHLIRFFNGIQKENKGKGAGRPHIRNGLFRKGDPAHCAAMSMCDLALPDQLDDLRRAGVASLKIEGRKKSPLYVSVVTDYYRRLLDGKLSAEIDPAQPSPVGASRSVPS